MDGDVCIACLNFNAARIFDVGVLGESVKEADVGVHMADDGGAVVSLDEDSGVGDK